MSFYVKVHDRFIGHNISVNKYGNIVLDKRDTLVLNKLQAKTFSDPKDIIKVASTLGIALEAIKLIKA